MYFTDDGFAIGVAYILAILGQNRHFDSLHWFDAQKGVYMAELQAIEARREGLRRAKDKDGLEDAMFQEKRVRTMAREVEMLEWSLSAARIFFRE